MESSARATTSRWAAARRHRPVPGRVLLGAVCGALALGLGGCSNPGSSANLTVERYLSAIQQRGDRGMAVLWAPYRRQTEGMTKEEAAKALASFSALIRKANDDFERAKKEGTLTPDDLGVEMFRALGIGKGAYSVPLGVAFDDAGGRKVAKVTTRIVTNLGGVNLAGLPDGVRVYLPGYPFGKLAMIAVGYDRLEDQSLLGSVDVNWRLVKATAGMSSPTGWLIESISPDPSSAVEWKPSGRRR